MNNNINLLPLEFRIKKPKTSLNYITIIIVLLGVLILGGGILSFGWIKFIEYRTSRIEKQLSNIMAEKTKIEALEKENKQLKAMITEFNKIQGDKKRWTPLFADLNYYLPQEMWISDFSIDQDGKIQIQGLAEDLATVGVFIYEISQSSYFKEINLQQSQELIIGHTSVINYILEGKFQGKDGS